MTLMAVPQVSLALAYSPSTHTFLERMAELIGEIIAREGVFRVPKDAGSFLATVDA